ncbi:sel1 repeat family protein [Xanthomonas sp. A2111]|uniref:Sel1 repeat family protein n=1 Tax=Xanthomonas hawaiiensis TaxID=3003247 RepID=A0ABU2I3L4_9XANT|nr:sel1 repeat family protein [Xanthomonas sp. A2111]MBO9828835.1 sel1 repeat family protein [Xanthomonas sp. A2111]MDS9992745.1 sel1 repeat family protein [Xanthomonas sp. A2111]
MIITACLLVCAALVISITSHKNPGSSQAATRSTENILEPKEKKGPYSLRVPLTAIDRSVVTPVGGRAFVINRSSSGRPAGDVLSYILSIKDKSDRGDASATYSIFLAVQECKDALNTKSMNALEAMKKAGMGREYLAGIERNLNDCAALISNPEYYEAAWLQKAAQQGSVEAKLYYAASPESVIGPQKDYLKNSELATEWKENSLSYLQSASRLGSVDALLSLGNAYSAGIIAPTDPVMSFAYYNAADQVFPNAQSSQLIAHLQKNLTAAQQQSARHISQEIIKNCCTPR